VTLHFSNLFSMYLTQKKKFPHIVFQGT
jgi:hypothetical protein